MTDSTLPANFWQQFAARTKASSIAEQEQQFHALADRSIDELRIPICPSLLPYHAVIGGSDALPALLIAGTPTLPIGEALLALQQYERNAYHTDEVSAALAPSRLNEELGTAITQMKEAYWPHAPRKIPYFYHWKEEDVAIARETLADALYQADAPVNICPNAREAARVAGIIASTICEASETVLAHHYSLSQSR